MNVRLFNFALCSICVHIAVPWLLLHAGTFELGIARGMDNIQQVLSVKIITEEIDRQATARVTVDTTSSLDPAASVDEMPVPSTSQKAEAAAVAAALQTAADHDYATAGRLTRLPSPLYDIDLNVPEISASGFRGEARLTLRIDADGSVADVISSDEPPALNEFTERVAARFRSARFVPGEIDGRPVKSQLQITVVSENPDTGG